MEIKGRRLTSKWAIEFNQTKIKDGPWSKILTSMRAIPIALSLCLLTLTKRISG